MTERLDFGQSIEGMVLPPSERSASAPLVILYQQESLFPRTLLDDNSLRLPSFLEWWVPQRKNDRHPFSDETRRFKHVQEERGDTIVRHKT